MIFSSSHSHRRRLNQSKIMSVLIIGGGRMGAIRADAVYANPRLTLAGIVDVDPRSATGIGPGPDLARKYSTPFFTSLEGALATLTAPPAGIICCTPTFTHPLVIEVACKTSIPIFIEKPVDETTDGIREMFALGANTSTPICCGFQRRFDPSYMSVKKSVDDGAIGSVVTTRIFFADHPCPPIEFLKAGGNSK
jgi:myo-inositol 2-dehydrogenase/D-chiro-inositol 1-dehydrogenase